MCDKLDLVTNTLQESNVILRKNLNPGDILRSMMSEGELTQDDVTKISRQDTTTEQVDKLIEVLTRKPAKAYKTFMHILQRERSDLYDQIKSIEGGLTS